MSYTKQTWVDGATPLSATRMNYMEAGIAAAASVICTSTTRPSAGLFAGMTIFETDTKASAVYDGTTWQYTTPQVSAQALINGWANWADGHTTDNPVYEKLQITRLGTRRFMNGMITAAVAANTSSVFCTLAAGDRPTHRLSRRQVGLDGYNSNVSPLRIDIDPATGSVTYTCVAAIALQTDYVYLDFSWNVANNV
jgi:hypothetical protein